MTLLLPNPAHRYPAGLRERPRHARPARPRWPPALAALGDVRWPVLQTSANAAGAATRARWPTSPSHLRAHSDLVLDGGELPGTPSTVVDLREYEERLRWSIVRPGAVAERLIHLALG